MAIDVQQSSLWYVVVAWEPSFSGYVLDYGVWPKQNRTVFTLADIVDSPNSLAAKYPGRGVEGAITAGLEELVSAGLGRDFHRAGGGGLIRISRLIVDSGKWPGAIAAVKHKLGGATMTLSKGFGITAGKKPMASYKRKLGERHGHHWYTPTTKGTREFPYIAIDTNHWKTQVHRGLLTPASDPGAITLFGAGTMVHGLFAAHMTAETYVTPTSPGGVPVDEWSLLPQRPDNHWFDCMVMAAVAASYQGIKTGAEADKPVKRSNLPPPMSLGELAKNARRK
jgi:hypothetical protein